MMQFGKVKSRYEMRRLALVGQRDMLVTTGTTRTTHVQGCPEHVLYCIYLSCLLICVVVHFSCVVYCLFLSSSRLWRPSKPAVKLSSLTCYLEIPEPDLRSVRLNWNWTFVAFSTGHTCVLSWNKNLLNLTFRRALKMYFFGWLGLQNLVTFVFSVLYKCSYLLTYLNRKGGFICWIHKL